MQLHFSGPEWPEAAHRERLAYFEAKQGELERARERLAQQLLEPRGPFFAGQLAVAKSMYATAAREARAADAEEIAARLR